MNLWQRWKKTSLPNQLLVVVGGITALSGGIQIWLSQLNASESSLQADKLIEAGNAMVRNLEQANKQHLKATEESLKETVTTGPPNAKP